MLTGVNSKTSQVGWAIAAGLTPLVVALALSQIRKGNLAHYLAYGAGVSAGSVALTRLALWKFTKVAAPPAEPKGEPPSTEEVVVEETEEVIVEEEVVEEVVQPKVVDLNGEEFVALATGSQCLSLLTLLLNQAKGEDDAANIELNSFFARLSEVPDCANRDIFVRAVVPWGQLSKNVCADKLKYPGDPQRCAHVVYYLHRTKSLGYVAQPERSALSAYYATVKVGLFEEVLTDKGLPLLLPAQDSDQRAGFYEQLGQCTIVVEDPTVLARFANTPEARGQLLNYLTSMRCLSKVSEFEQGVLLSRMAVDNSTAMKRWCKANAAVHQDLKSFWSAAREVFSRHKLVALYNVACQTELTYDGIRTKMGWFSDGASVFARNGYSEWWNKFGAEVVFDWKKGRDCLVLKAEGAADVVIGPQAQCRSHVDYIAIEGLSFHELRALKVPKRLRPSRSKS